MPSGKIMVAMSGGVDSSVAALLLKQQGFEVVGVTMCLGVSTEGADRPVCCGPEAVSDARAVCDALDIPHYVMDYSAQLRVEVIDPFIEEYRAGRTPNPCVRCNQRLKFGSLLTKARAMGFDGLATGHYSRIGRRNGRACLQRGRDPRKDQSYFLYAIPRASLDAALFPVGDLVKDEVRALASRAGLPVADKAESQDICFTAGADYRVLLGEGASQAGAFVDVSGTRLGTHRGIAHYTVGQRKGLGIAARQPLYVIALRPARNEVVLGERAQLLASGLTARQLNWLTDGVPSAAQAMIRYNHPAVGCTMGVDGDELRVFFQEPQEAVAPGQSVVLYEGDTVLGGGIIGQTTGTPSAP
jgi:tRNA-specific 2-thiouridylase